jgi:hypothetical protein
MEGQMSKNRKLRNRNLIKDILKEGKPLDENGQTKSHRLELIAHSKMISIL